MDEQRAKLIRKVWRKAGPQWDRREWRLIVPLIPPTSRWHASMAPLMFEQLVFERQPCEPINGYPAERVVCEGIEVDRIADTSKERRT